MDTLKVGDPGEPYTVMIIQWDVTVRNILHDMVSRDVAAMPLTPQKESEFESLLGNLPKGEVDFAFVGDKMWDRKVGDGTTAVATTWRNYIYRLLPLLPKGQGVVIYTGSHKATSDEIQDVVVEAGCQYRHFPKPFGFEELQAMLREYRQQAAQA